ncbi:hypothetical protein Sjap_002781 [Stephania japonica]|uniref:FAS1 domain-containing protein n=1 Tax=Stephania japonica TaxID=461633 RepID=A0AAP0KMH6_9MAGN
MPSFLVSLFCITILSLTLAPPIVTASYERGPSFPIQKVTKAVFDAGYETMSQRLEMVLPTLFSQVLLRGINHSSSPALTIFCPTDGAFASSKYPQPPITLLQYHAVPMKLKVNNLQSSGKAAISTGSKIDSLLNGHPIVVTTSPAPKKRSSRRPAPDVFVNGIEVRHWDVYNDGFIVVHGVDDVLDPAYQTIWYPWFESHDGVNSCAPNAIDSSTTSTHQEVGLKEGIITAVVGWGIRIPVRIHPDTAGDSLQQAPTRQGMGAFIPTMQDGEGVVFPLPSRRDSPSRSVGIPMGTLNIPYGDSYSLNSHIT